MAETLTDLELLLSPLIGVTVLVETMVLLAISEEFPVKEVVSEGDTDDDDATPVVTTTI